MNSGTSGAGRAAGNPSRRDAQRRAVPTPLAIAVALIVLLVAGVAFVGGAGAAALTTPTAADGPTASKTFDAVRLAPAAPAGLQPFRTCSIDDITAQAGALTFHGYAIDSQTGEVLFDRRADDPNPTASTLKLAVAAAALTVLGPDYRIPTRIYEGELQGEVIVVGGGDVTLSSLAPGIASYYDGATAFVSDLAQQAIDAHGDDPITYLSYDDSVFSGDAWQPSWMEADRTDGYVAPVTGLMVDGDRAVPQSQTSPRSEDPTERAVNAVADRLGVPPSGLLGSSSVPEGAQLLAEVWSQPVSELVRYQLLDSDNMVSEMLARLVAIESGTGNTFEAINPAITQAIANLGLDTTGLLAADGSGLSRDNRVTAQLEVALLQLIGTDEFGLGTILEYLPASGLTGTLDTRFDPASSGVPGGAIRAKTGWIEEVYGLAGFIDTADGTKITFAYYVVGTVQIVNRDVLDSIAATTYQCGGSLADW